MVVPTMIPPHCSCGLSWMLNVQGAEGNGNPDAGAVASIGIHRHF